MRIDFNLRYVENLLIMIRIVSNLSPYVAWNIQDFRLLHCSSTNSQWCSVNLCHWGIAVLIFWVSLVVKNISIVAKSECLKPLFQNDQPFASTRICQSKAQQNSFFRVQECTTSSEVEFIIKVANSFQLTANDFGNLKKQVSMELDKIKLTCLILLLLLL